MQFAYLLFLIVSIAGLATIDRRWKLAYWHDRRRTVITVSVAVAVFVLWDLFGIWSGIFFHGDSSFILPFTILPEFPIEEIFFLVLLCYSTLIVYRGGVKLWHRT